MRYTLLALLCWIVPVAAAPLEGQVMLRGNLQPLPATTGVVYVVPDTPETWLQLSGMGKRINLLANVTRYSATQVQDYGTLYNYNLAQERVKGLVNRLMLTARARASQTLTIDQGRFSAVEPEEKVILVASAQATLEGTTLAGWWLLRTTTTTALTLGRDEQLYQIGIPVLVQTPPLP